MQQERRSSKKRARRNNIHSNDIYPEVIVHTRLGEGVIMIKLGEKENRNEAIISEEDYEGGF